MSDFTPTIAKVSEDARGEMYAITLPGDRELLLIHSKAGALRGGHSHNVDETVVMLTGSMAYHKQYPRDGEETEQLKDGDASKNLAGLYHMGEFLEDSWLIEWKIDTKKGAWTNRDLPRWRERVKANQIS